MKNRICEMLDIEFPARRLHPLPGRGGRGE